MSAARRTATNAIRRTRRSGLALQRVLKNQLSRAFSTQRPPVVPAGSFETRNRYLGVTDPFGNVLYVVGPVK
jgi:hypothetical protein